ncbi:hypothetical protein BJV74DRAFT_864822 [Russula compacta]|nr:hypothetical protein BJV74DRAFT_864822 [Russula compacta]
MLALSMRMTLFGPGNGFIRSSNVSMKWWKVIALNEPSTMFTCKTPSRLIAGRTEYRVPLSYATSIDARLPL